MKTALIIISAALAVLTAVRADQTQSTPENGSEALAVATFAGGCFWCMEGPYDALDGVVSTTSGYIGGEIDNPTYKQVSAGGTGHTEALQIAYDPSRVSYQQLLDIFWVNHDPTDAQGQFCDKGSQYRPGIFYHDQEQKLAAEASKESIKETKPFKEPVITEITMAGKFFAAEDYHQDYYLRNPIRYKFYRYSCGRDARLKQLWGDLAAH